MLSIEEETAASREVHGTRGDARLQPVFPIQLLTRPLLYLQLLSL